MADIYPWDHRPDEGVCDHCEALIVFQEDADFDGEKFVSCGVWVETDVASHPLYVTEDDLYDPTMCPVNGVHELRLA